jgi:hypothetical protein
VRAAGRYCHLHDSDERFRRVCAAVRNVLDGGPVNTDRIDVAFQFFVPWTFSLDFNYYLVW